MTDLFANFDWHLFLSIKLLFVPLILLSIALVEKKFGTVLGGALSGLPLVSGTLLSFSVFTQSYSDYSLSIYGALAGVISLSLMVFTYSKLTYSITGGSDMTLSSKERWSVMLKSILVYLTVSGLFSFIQKTLNELIDSNSMVPLVFIACCGGLNLFLFLKLPKIRPDENKVNFKFKNTLYMALIGTITFSVFSSIKVYGSSSALIGLISTAPFYLSVVIFMTHKFGTDYDALHLNRGILVGFFGYIMFFSIFLIGLTLLHLSPQVVVPAGILMTIGSYVGFAVFFQRRNKKEVTQLSTHAPLSALLPDEEQFDSFLEQKMLNAQEEKIEEKAETKVEEKI